MNLLVGITSTSLIRLARFGIIHMFRLSTAMDFGMSIASPCNILNIDVTFVEDLLLFTVCIICHV